MSPSFFFWVIDGKGVYVYIRLAYQAILQRLTFLIKEKKRKKRKERKKAKILMIPSVAEARARDPNTKRTRIYTYSSIHLTRR